MVKAMSAQANLRPSALSMACSQLESYPDVSVSPEALLTPGVLITRDSAFFCIAEVIAAADLFDVGST